MPMLVNHLAIRNIKAIVLTALPTKPIGKIQEPIKWRAKILSEFGYNFGKFWEELSDKTFFENSIQPHPPAYHNGIICVAIMYQNIFPSTNFDTATMTIIDNMTNTIEMVFTINQINALFLMSKSSQQNRTLLAGSPTYRNNKQTTNKVIPIGSVKISPVKNDRFRYPNMILAQKRTQTPTICKRKEKLD